MKRLHKLLLIISSLAMLFVFALSLDTKKDVKASEYDIDFLALTTVYDKNPLDNESNAQELDYVDNKKVIGLDQYVQVDFYIYSINNDYQSFENFQLSVVSSLPEAFEFIQMKYNFSDTDNVLINGNQIDRLANTTKLTKNTTTPMITAVFKLIDSSYYNKEVSFGFDYTGVLKEQVDEYKEQNPNWVASDLPPLFSTIYDTNGSNLNYAQGLSSIIITSLTLDGEDDELSGVVWTCDKQKQELNLYVRDSYYFGSTPNRSDSYADFINSTNTYTFNNVTLYDYQYAITNNADVTLSSVNLFVDLKDLISMYDTDTESSYYQNANKLKESLFLRVFGNNELKTFATSINDNRPYISESDTKVNIPVFVLVKEENVSYLFLSSYSLDDVLNTNNPYYGSSDVFFLYDYQNEDKIKSQFTSQDINDPILCYDYETIYSPSCRINGIFVDREFYYNDNYNFPTSEIDECLINTGSYKVGAFIDEETTKKLNYKVETYTVNSPLLTLTIKNGALSTVKTEWNEFYRYYNFASIYSDRCYIDEYDGVKDKSYDLLCVYDTNLSKYLSKSSINAYFVKNHLSAKYYTITLDGDGDEVKTLYGFNNAPSDVGLYEIVFTYTNNQTDNINDFATTSTTVRFEIKKLTRDALEEGTDPSLPSFKVDNTNNVITSKTFDALKFDETKVLLYANDVLLKDNEPDDYDVVYHYFENTNSHELSSDNVALNLIDAGYYYPSFKIKANSNHDEIVYDSNSYVEVSRRSLSTKYEYSEDGKTAYLVLTEYEDYKEYFDEYYEAGKLTAISYNYAEFITIDEFEGKFPFKATLEGTNKASAFASCNYKNFSNGPLYSAANTYKVSYAPAYSFDNISWYYVTSNSKIEGQVDEYYFVQDSTKLPGGLKVYLPVNEEDENFPKLTHYKSNGKIHSSNGFISGESYYGEHTLLNDEYYFTINGSQTDYFSFNFVYEFIEQDFLIVTFLAGSNYKSNITKHNAYEIEPGGFKFTDIRIYKDTFEEDLANAISFKNILNSAEFYTDEPLIMELMEKYFNINESVFYIVKNTETNVLEDVLIDSSITFEKLSNSYKPQELSSDNRNILIYYEIKSNIGLGDVNGDTLVNTNDTIAYRKYLVGLDNCSIYIPGEANYLVKSPNFDYMCKVINYDTFNVENPRSISLSSIYHIIFSASDYLDGLTSPSDQTRYNEIKGQLSELFDGEHIQYFITDVADLNKATKTSTSLGDKWIDVRDASTISMALVEGYGYVNKIDSSLNGNHYAVQLADDEVTTLYVYNGDTTDHPKTSIDDILNAINNGIKIKFMEDYDGSTVDFEIVPSKGIKSHNLSIDLNNHSVLFKSISYIAGYNDSIKEPRSYTIKMDV